VTPHIEAIRGDYAPTVLMPGDPRRATHIAEKFLTQVRQVNGVRNCFGYTGYYRGHRVSVQASGMGQPSLGIYATELFDLYDVHRIIRVGTCGAFDPAVELGELIVPLTASSDSQMGANLFAAGTHVAPACSFALLEAVLAFREKSSSRIRLGSLYSSGRFYQEDEHWWHPYRQAGVLGVDMETHYLYLEPMHRQRQALTINAVSDNLATGKSLSSSERVTATDATCELILASLFPTHGQD